MADDTEAKGPGGRPLTEKQEAFALAYFETGNAAEAYRRAYDVDENARDSWLYVEACQLLDHPKIALRVRQLRDQAQTLSIFNVLKASEEYEEARQLAMSEGAAAAAVSAITGKVKLFGLEPVRKHRMEHSGPNGGAIPVEETPRERIARRLASLAARGGPDEDAGGAD